MKKWYWIITSFLILSFVLYKAVEKGLIIGESLKYKYVTVESVKVFTNDEYGLKSRFHPNVFFKNLNGEIGFFNSGNKSQFMIYQFSNPNIESLIDSKFAVIENIKN